MTRAAVGGAVCTGAFALSCKLCSERRDSIRNLRITSACTTTDGVLSPLLWRYFPAASTKFPAAQTREF